MVIDETMVLALSALVVIVGSTGAIFYKSYKHLRGNKK